MIWVEALKYEVFAVNKVSPRMPVPIAGDIEIKVPALFILTLPI